MARKLIIIASIFIFIFAGIVLGAIPKKICPACKEEIAKTDYCVLQGGIEVHFKHGYQAMLNNNRAELQVEQRAKK